MAYGSFQPAIKKYQDQLIDPQTQKWLNQPQTQSAKLEPKQEEFLKFLMQKIATGGLDPLRPASLYDQAVYAKLSETDQEKADLTALNIMSIIKQIDMLWSAHPESTFQVANLVETVWQMKSKFEAKYGNVYVI